MSPSLFHLSISGAFLRNLLPATPRLFGFRPPDLVVWKMYPQSPEKNGYMWYASPPEPCWTASPTGAPLVATVFRLSRIDPKSLTTTLTSTPRVLPQALVTLSTSAFLFWSVHTTIVVAWLAAAPSWAAGAIGASTSIAAAKAAASVTTPTRVMRFFMFEPSPVFGLTEASLVSRSWRGQRAVRPIFVRART